MAEHNIFRDGRVHVMAEECPTCIFRPHSRPVDGARVAGMVRDTLSQEGATIVCHATLYRGEPERHAICAGWYARLGHTDNLIRMAQRLGIVTEQAYES